MTRKHYLIRTKDTVAVELESSVVQHEINATASLPAEIPHDLPEARKVISKDVLLGRSEVVTTSRLKLFDVFFSHVDE